MVRRTSDVSETCELEPRVSHAPGRCARHHLRFWGTSQWNHNPITTPVILPLTFSFIFKILSPNSHSSQNTPFLDVKFKIKQTLKYIKKERDSLPQHLTLEESPGVPRSRATGRCEGWVRTESPRRPWARPSRWWGGRWPGHWVNQYNTGIMWALFLELMEPTVYSNDNNNNRPTLAEHSTCQTHFVFICYSLTLRTTSEESTIIPTMQKRKI